MTYAKWEKDFKRELSFLKKSESEEVAAYYRELYGDKSDAGMSCDDILFEFGSPQHCAAKILEERIHNNFPDASLKDESVRPTRERNGTPLFRYIGLFFFTILISNFSTLVIYESHCFIRNALIFQIVNIQKIHFICHICLRQTILLSFPVMPMQSEVLLTAYRLLRPVRLSSSSLHPLPSGMQ